jgi:hypothetical protein
MKDDDEARKARHRDQDRRNKAQKRQQNYDLQR